MSPQTKEAIFLSVVIALVVAATAWRACSL